MPLNRPPVLTGHVILNRWLSIAGLAVLILVATLVLSSNDVSVPSTVVSASAQHPAEVDVADQAAAAQAPDVTVRGRHGHVTCPQGATPTVSIGYAKFRPRLLAGTQFRRGVTYHVVLRGWAVNETTAPITIRRIVTRAGTSRWKAVRRHPDALDANSKGMVEIRGTLHSTSRHQVHLEALLRWHWTAKRLRPCGDRGLIDDD